MTRLDHCAHASHPRLFVAVGPTWDRARDVLHVAEIVDEVQTRRLVLDQYRIGPELSRQALGVMPEFGISQLAAKDIEDPDVAAVDVGGYANRVVVVRVLAARRIP